METEAREALCQIIAAEGRGICDDPPRLEALLRERCVQHKRELNLLLGALREQIAADLLAASNNRPREMVLNGLRTRLQEDLSLTPEAAQWAVEAWAAALDAVPHSAPAPPEPKAQPNPKIQTAPRAKAKPTPDPKIAERKKQAEPDGGGMRRFIGLVLCVMGIKGILNAVSAASYDQYGTVSRDFASNLAAMSWEQRGYVVGYLAVALVFLMFGALLQKP